MIWPHRIRVSYSRPYDPPREDDYGNAILEVVDQLVPGQVTPLTAGNAIESGVVYTETRYRIMLAPALKLPLASVAVQYEWQGVQLEPQGAPERHMLGGRLHHYEVLSQSLT